MGGVEGTSSDPLRGCGASPAWVEGCGLAFCLCRLVGTSSPSVSAFAHRHNEKARPSSMTTNICTLDVPTPTSTAVRAVEWDAREKEESGKRRG